MCIKPQALQPQRRQYVHNLRHVLLRQACMLISLYPHSVLLITCQHPPPTAANQAQVHSVTVADLKS
jgi:hypothetical protein